ncbi:uncharacterized protein LOC129298587 [Prosopis cineraria]|uniref:uncharacterized protein LOC129298587 n=1 Tax=Prosopis cineraria TaxID=364024 RepID=UPI0024107C5F|nr:uncharacterized protein LOC129298587 [Prosopis cineraria]
MNSILKLHFSSSTLLLRSNHTNLPCPFATNNNLPTRTVHQSLRFASQSPVMRKALPHSSVIIAASTSPPKPLDMSVFLQTSALLLCLYFTANFIVPELISKYFGFDKVKEDQNVNDVNATEER